nr:hypothetical protein 16 [Spirochaetaceae bacterium]
MSGKLTESRMIRVYLLAVSALLAVAAVNAGLAWWITRQAIGLAQSDIEVPRVLDTVASTAAGAAAVGTAIATITTALIARYGAREATRNLGRGTEGGK